MAVCRNIGHDMRAKQTGEDDLPAILEKFLVFKKTNNIPKPSEIGFVVKFSKLTDSTLTPHTYWYRSQHSATLQREIALGDLMDEGIIETYSGKGVEAKIYTSSGIPFVRTSDIRNFEIARRTAKYISNADYQKIKSDFDVRHKDILFVRRGRTGTSKSNGLIGEVAFVMKHQTGITLQGAITGIRVVKPDNAYGLTPEILLFLLSDDHVKKQVKSLCGTENALTGLTDETFPKIKIDLRAAKELSDIHDGMTKLIEGKEKIEDLLRKLGR